MVAHQGVHGLILDGSATAAGMSRLFDGENVKDTVKDNAGEKV